MIYLHCKSTCQLLLLINPHVFLFFICVSFRDLISCVAVWRQSRDHPLQQGWPRLQKAASVYLPWWQWHCVCKVTHTHARTAHERPHSNMLMKTHQPAAIHLSSSLVHLLECISHLASCASPRLHHTQCVWNIILWLRRSRYSTQSPARLVHTLTCP